MDRRNVVTGVLCAAAAVAVSAAMTLVVPPQEAVSGPGDRPVRAGSGAGAAVPAPTASRAVPTAPQAAPRPFGAATLPTVGTPIPTKGPTDARAVFTGALFKDDLAGGHFCSATVVRSPGRDLIVTAGHCLTPGAPEGETTVFAPGYADGKAPYGTWRVAEVFEDRRWTDGEDDDYDLAFARLEPDARGRRVEDVTGGAPLDTSGRTAEEVTVTGYPTDRNVPRTCTAVSVKESDTVQRFDCADFPVGTSGSAWIAADGKIVGVLTGGDTDDQSTSTVLGTYAAELYRRATAR
ncbi:serine protease [Streptomyces sp. NRRL S-87]|uniref:trypsin-like serine peptidase n=1 Tax=Streptomyces sp. NRRL S-87 TaxID=1463920 RepID=UPI001F3B64FD|nr:trypsin-like peptidase domain-containing protein [Streptomyces sp. NRRL S-87]